MKKYQRLHKNDNFDYLLIYMIDSGVHRLTDLAILTNNSPQAIWARLQRLVKMGYIQCIDSSQSQKRKGYRLAEPAEELIQKINLLETLIRLKLSA
jgi:DNA-binding HxlR family transcriptional regulator